MISPYKIASSRIELPAGGHIQAPSENVSQFSELLNGMQTGLKAGKSSLTKATPAQSKPQGSLMEKLALDVHQSENESHALRREIHKNIAALKEGATTDASFSAAIVREKFAATAYFVSLNLMGSHANDMAEEVNSVTKGKSS